MNKRFKTPIAIALLFCMATLSSQAQYYELANQLPSLISPALSGSMRYKGYVDAGFTGGFTDNKANLMSFSTSQGFQYADWFFMGAGIGVDVTFRNNDLNMESPSDRWDYSTTSTGVMMPIFTDFRFILGNSRSVTQFFIDLKIGATFLLGNDYMEFKDGYLTNNANFYLKPTIGVRIPVNSKNQRQAVNLGIAYQLITSGNNLTWYGGNTLTLNSIGATVGFEW